MSDYEDVGRYSSSIIVPERTLYWTTSCVWFLKNTVCMHEALNPRAYHWVICSRYISPTPLISFRSVHDSRNWQVVTWLVIPKLLQEGRIELIMTILLATYLFQFFPKLYHSIYLLRKLQKVTGYIFGGDWWPLHLNVLAYLIASHVSLLYPLIYIHYLIRIFTW